MQDLLFFAKLLFVAVPGGSCPCRAVILAARSHTRPHARNRHTYGHHRPVCIHPAPRGGNAPSIACMTALNLAPSSPCLGHFREIVSALPSPATPHHCSLALAGAAPNLDVCYP